MSEFELSPIINTVNDRKFYNRARQNIRNGNFNNLRWNKIGIKYKEIGRDKSILNFMKSIFIQYRQEFPSLINSEFNENLINSTLLDLLLSHSKGIDKEQKINYILKIIVPPFKLVAPNTKENNSRQNYDSKFIEQLSKYANCNFEALNWENKNKIPKLLKFVHRQLSYKKRYEYIQAIINKCNKKLEYKLKKFDTPKKKD